MKTTLFRTPASLILLVVLIAPTVAAGQGEQSRLTGRVTDESDGALPGVTVTVTSPRQDKPFSAVTDGVGRYLFPALPPDTYAVTFEMPGFETLTNPALLLRAGEEFSLDQQLGLAPLTETVTVVASAPPPPAPAPVSLPPAVRPRPAMVPIDNEALASVCGPSQPADTSLAIGRIIRHRDDPNRQLYGHGDILVLDVGTDHDITTGQNFVVRRRFRIGDKGLPLKDAVFGEHTAGLIQVVEASRASSIAMVVYACDEFVSGDGIEPFEAVTKVTEIPSGTPQFDQPARIVFGDDGRMTGAPPQLMVIDHGANEGVARGQRLTIFRRPRTDRGTVSTIGDGIVVAVRPNGATIRLERANDAVLVGDLVALHR